MLASDIFVVEKTLCTAKLLELFFIFVAIVGVYDPGHERVILDGGSLPQVRHDLLFQVLQEPLQGFFDARIHVGDPPGLPELFGAYLHELLAHVLYTASDLVFDGFLDFFFTEYTFDSSHFI